MSAIDDAIKKCDKALKLASEIQRDVYRYDQHQKLIGIMLGIVIAAGVFWLATRS